MNELDKNIQGIYLATEGMKRLLSSIQDLKNKIEEILTPEIKEMAKDIYENSANLEGNKRRLEKEFETSDVAKPAYVTFFEEFEKTQLLEKFGSEINVFRNTLVKEFCEEVFYMKTYFEDHLEGYEPSNKYSKKELKDFLGMLDIKYIEGLEIQATSLSGEFKSVNVNAITNEGKNLQKIKNMFGEYQKGISLLDEKVLPEDIYWPVIQPDVYIKPYAKIIELMQLGKLSPEAVSYHYNEITTKGLVRFKEDMNRAHADLEDEIFTGILDEKKDSVKAMRSLIKDTIHNILEVEGPSRNI